MVPHLTNNDPKERPMNRNRRLRTAVDYSLIIALGCLLTLLIAAWWLPPAHGADWDPVLGEITDTPEVTMPLVAVDGTTPHLVVVEAPRLSWRSRMAARAWDDAVPGLDVRTGTCVPELPCIRIHVGYWAPDRALEVSGSTGYWAGLMVTTSASQRDVYLNRARSPRGGGRTRVASHEIGHALGLGHHHGQTGVLGEVWSNEWKPSEAEAAALAAYFTGPTS